MEIIIDATLTQEKPYCGMERYLLHLMKELFKQNKKDHFILLQHKNTSSTLNEFFKKLPKNAEIYEIPKMLPAMINPLAFPLQIRPALKKLKRKYPKAIYFAPFHVKGFSPKLLPTVVVIHDFAQVRTNWYADRNRLINLGRKAEFWYYMNKTVNCDAVLTHAEFTIEDMKIFLPKLELKKVHPNYLGVEVKKGDQKAHKKYLPDDWKERGYLIYMGGGIQKNKNSKGVIKGYAEFLRILEQKKGIKQEDAPYLVIAGRIFAKTDYAPAQELRNVGENLGIADNILYTGEYGEDEKYALLVNSFAYTHLSIFEGFGIAIAEAMKVGVPVVAHDGSTYTEVVGDAGILVDGEDAEEVGQAYYKLFAEPEYAAEIGAKCLERSEMFTWDKTAKSTMEVFRKVYDENYGD